MSWVVPYFAASCDVWGVGGIKLTGGTSGLEPLSALVATVPTADINLGSVRGPDNICDGIAAADISTGGADSIAAADSAGAGAGGGGGANGASAGASALESVEVGTGGGANGAGAGAGASESIEAGTGGGAGVADDDECGEECRDAGADTDIPTWSLRASTWFCSSSRPSSSHSKLASIFEIQWPWLRTVFSNLSIRPSRLVNLVSKLTRPRFWSPLLASTLSTCLSSWSTRLPSVCMQSTMSMRSSTSVEDIKQKIPDNIS